MLKTCNKQFKMDGRPKNVRKYYQLSVVKAGQFLGEKEILENIPRTATARVQNTVTLFQISRSRLRKVFHECIGMES